MTFTRAVQRKRVVHGQWRAPASSVLLVDLAIVLATRIIVGLILLGCTYRTDVVGQCCTVPSHFQLYFVRSYCVETAAATCFRVDHLLGILPDSSLRHIFAPLSLYAHQALHVSI